ncbi:unnamed protein product [Mytilus coruscus]|uniref:DZIP3-like HEPN domain-containing protein n=1 Tax=Mytilus coruscus TaxID=42192 RepID=A0A6J8AZI3_MYTCO|nr:unnamed protein product [Mytilus coruscus]
MTSISQLKEEEKNFARFFLLNFKISPEIARRFFDGIFPPKNLAQTINNSVPGIINLYNRKRINTIQLDILRGVPGTKWSPHRPAMPLGTTATSFKDFDLTTLICLLRNLRGLLTPSNGWDQLPHPNDTLPGADLATLKWFRNQLAHTTVTSMDNNEFTDKWKLVEKALTCLKKGQRSYEVTEILNYDIDGEQAKTLANTELKQLKKECIDCEKEIKQIESDFSHYREGNIPKNIAEKCDEKIYRIMQTCGLQRNMPKTELEDAALSAIGSYLTKDNDNFRFIHDALEETIGCHFYTFDPKVMFSDCDIFFIRDRVRAISNENTDENIDENIVSIREDELTENRLRPLYNRLWIELKNGIFSNLLMSHLFSNRNFVRIFGITFDQSIHTFLKKVSFEQGQVSNDSVFIKYLKILSNDEFIENKDAISRVIIARGNKSTLIDWIVAFGCYEFFSIFME